MRKILIVLCLMSAVRFVNAANLGDIRNDIRFNILDTTSTSHNTRYSDSFLNYRINQANKEIARACYPLYSSVLIGAVTGQQEYTISTDTLKIDKVVFLINTSTGSYRKLIQSTIQSLDNDKGILWEALPPGLPTNYYQKANILGLVPAPASSYANANAIKVYYYREVQDMVSDSDNPYNGIYVMQDYYTAIIYAVTWRCKHDKGSSWADDYKLYSDYVAKMQADLQTTRTDSSVITVTK